MRCHDNAKSIFSQLFDKAHGLNLVAKVQMGCRLIQKDKIRLLHNGSGNGYKLSLTAADLRIGLFNEMLYTYTIQRPLHLLVVGVAW